MVPSYFSTLLQTRHDFKGVGGVEDVTEYKMCLLIFSTTLSETFLIIRRALSGIINVGPGVAEWLKALRYYSDGPGIESRWCHWVFQ